MGVQVCVTRDVTQVIQGCNNMSVQVCAIPVIQVCRCVCYIEDITRLVISLEIYQMSLRRV